MAAPTQSNIAISASDQLCPACVNDRKSAFGNGAAFMRKTKVETRLLSNLDSLARRLSYHRDTQMPTKGGRVVAARKNILTAP